jgi:hypothetical protein
MSGTTRKSSRVISTNEGGHDHSLVIPARACMHGHSRNSYRHSTFFPSTMCRHSLGRSARGYVVAK